MWQTILLIILTASAVYSQYEYIQKFLAAITKLFCFFGLRFERLHLSLDIESKINLFSRKAFNEIKIKEKPQVKIKFVQKTTLESFFKDNKIVIHMDCSEHRNRNLCLATIQYVSKSILIKARKYFSEALNDGMNLMITKKIIKSNGTRDEKDYFDSVILHPKCQKSGELNQICEKINSLDEKGYFTRLFIREMYFLGYTLEDTWPTEGIRKEIDEFFDYVERLSHTPVTEVGGKYLKPHEFSYAGNFIKARVILFARREVTEMWGEQPYLKRLKEGLKSGANVFYLIGREDSVEFVKKFEKSVHQKLVVNGVLKLITRRIYKIPYGPSKGNKHICVAYRTMKSLSGGDIAELFKDVPETVFEDLNGDEQNKRQFQRLAKMLNAEFTQADTINLADRSKLSKGNLLNLSYGGICLNVKLDDNKKVGVAFTLPDGSQIRVVGDVVWVSESTNESGIQFDKFNTDGKKYLGRLNKYLDSEIN